MPDFGAPPGTMGMSGMTSTMFFVSPIIIVSLSGARDWFGMTLDAFASVMDVSASNVDASKACWFAETWCEMSVGSTKSEILDVFLRGHRVCCLDNLLMLPTTGTDER